MSAPQSTTAATTFLPSLLYFSLFPPFLPSFTRLPHTMSCPAYAEKSLCIFFCALQIFFISTQKISSKISEFAVLVYTLRKGSLALDVDWIKLLNIYNIYIVIYISHRFESALFLRLSLEKLNIFFLPCNTLTSS